MDRIIPSVIDELKYLDSLPSSYMPLIDYYNKVGSLSNIHTGDVYEFEGKQIRIGNMIAQLRFKHKRGMLADDKVQLLNRLGIKWSYDRFDGLREYYKEFGTLSTITYETTYTYNQKTVNLGSIVYNMRDEYKRGLLSQDLIDEFNSMGMIWGIKIKNNELIEILEAYYNKYGEIGEIKIKSKFTHNGKRIDMGTQIAKLRRMYHAGELTTDEIAKLESIGMVWQLKRNNEENIAVVKSYFARTLPDSCTWVTHSTRPCRTSSSATSACRATAPFGCPAPTTPVSQPRSK